MISYIISFYHKKFINALTLNPHVSTSSDGELKKEQNEHESLEVVSGDTLYAVHDCAQKFPL